MSHVELAAFQQTGYVVLDPYDEPIDPTEWLGLEYVDWKSSGDTRFAPLASAQGAVECNGFWHFDPPRTDKDGVWIGAQTVVAPTLTRRAQEVGANVGRCRVIELQPNSYADALYNSHLDDNNRLNPDGHRLGRALLHAADRQPRLVHGAARRDVADPSTETRIALPAGAQLVVDSQRMWHSVWHPGVGAEVLPDHLVRVRPGPREVARSTTTPATMSSQRPWTRRRRALPRPRRRRAGPRAPPSTATTPRS